MLQVPTNVLFLQNLQPMHPRRELEVRFRSYAHDPEKKPPVILMSPIFDGTAQVVFDTVAEAMAAMEDIKAVKKHYKAKVDSKPSMVPSLSLSIENRTPHHQAPQSAQAAKTGLLFAPATQVNRQLVPLRKGGGLEVPNSPLQHPEQDQGQTSELSHNIETLVPRRPAMVMNENIRDDNKTVCDIIAEGPIQVSLNDENMVDGHDHHAEAARSNSNEAASDEDMVMAIEEPLDHHDHHHESNICKQASHSEEDHDEDEEKVSYGQTIVYESVNPSYHLAVPINPKSWLISPPPSPPPDWKPKRPTEGAISTVPYFDIGPAEPIEDAAGPSYRTFLLYKEKNPNLPIITLWEC